jgi:DNA-directed RNA polymerase subunit K/omega
MQIGLEFAGLAFCIARSENKPVCKEPPDTMDQMTSPDALNEDPATLLREHRGMYMMINAIARRAHDLHSGERAVSHLPDGSRDPVKIATQEFLEGKLDIIPRSEEPATGKDEV